MRAIPGNVEKMLSQVTFAILNRQKYPFGPSLRAISRVVPAPFFHSEDTNSVCVIIFMACASPIS
jgi:hypothetical protein